MNEIIFNMIFQKSRTNLEQSAIDLHVLIT